MEKDLAMQYANYDNALNQYFDRVLLDFISDDFKKEYYQLRNDILNEIFIDNECFIQDGCDSILYRKHKDYDDLMIQYINHYFNVKRTTADSFTLYEVELLMIEHYLKLCGYQKDMLGYWICPFENDHFHH